MSMKEVRQIAAEYAVAQTNEVMSLAIAKAYADGYRDGYRDRDEEVSIDIRDNKTEYVDLGLPSGTLWAADYESTRMIFYDFLICKLLLIIK